MKILHTRIICQLSLSFLLTFLDWCLPEYSNAPVHSLPPALSQACAATALPVSSPVAPAVGSSAAAAVVPAGPASVAAWAPRTVARARSRTRASFAP